MCSNTCDPPTVCKLSPANPMFLRRLHVRRLPCSRCSTFTVKNASSVFVYSHSWHNYWHAQVPAVSKEWRECRFHLTSSHKYKLLLLTGTPVVHDVNDRLHENFWTVRSIIIPGQAHTVTLRLFISNKSKLRLILRTGATNHLPSVLQYKNREVMTPSLLQTCQVYLLETANITEED